MVDEERIERLAEEMERSNCWGGDFGSRYMVGYFAEYQLDKLRGAVNNLTNSL